MGLLLLSGMTAPVGRAALNAELQSLSPSAEIVLYEIDATNLGAGIYRMHSGANELRTAIVWQGLSYSAFPIKAEGFELTGKGTLPRPKVTVANVTGAMSALVLLYEDLAGVKVTRIRTLAKFLDAVNFATGTNPSADPTAEYPRDVYYIDRKTAETRDGVEFELASSLDLAGVRVPARQIIQNYCPSAYRGAECGYTGANYFSATDAPVGSLAQDVCGKRLSSCRLRFPSGAELPYGGFPAAGLIRQ